MFKKVIFLISLSFTSYGFASDFTFKEKSPADRLFDKSYQGIQKQQEEQKFIFDPKKKISQENQSYQALLDERNAEEKSVFNRINMCDVSPNSAGCPHSLPWMNDPRKLQQMIQQAK